MFAWTTCAPNVAQTNSSPQSRSRNETFARSRRASMFSTKRPRNWSGCARSGGPSSPRRTPKMKRMHNELPPTDMGKAVLVHRCGTKPDPAKALTDTRETRDAIDAFIEDFAEKRALALAYMNDPDRDLIGEGEGALDRKSTRLNSSHLGISDAV